MIPISFSYVKEKGGEFKIWHIFHAKKGENN